MGHTLTGMSGGFNLMGQGGGQMDSSVMQGRDGMGQHQHPGVCVCVCVLHLSSQPQKGPC